MNDLEKYIKHLKLEAHPEGGYYRRTYKNDLGDERGLATAIYYLAQENFSKWHRIDADELWFWHAGAALTLETKGETQESASSILGADIINGHHPQLLVPRNTWQRARSEGEWTLVSCVVSPGFTFDTFEMIDD